MDYDSMANNKKLEILNEKLILASNEISNKEEKDKLIKEELDEFIYPPYKPIRIYWHL